MAPLTPPSTPLTREQAWNLAHASDFDASTNDEMVDPWDVDETEDMPARRRARDRAERRARREARQP